MLAFEDNVENILNREEILSAAAVTRPLIETIKKTHTLCRSYLQKKLN